MPEQTTDHPREESALDELARDDSSRKRFLRTLGGAGAVGAFGVLLAACGDDDKKDETTGGASGDTTTTSASAGGDVDIVNYALTLEFLEADFYKQVIASGLVKDPKVAELAKSIGQNEEEHVAALSAAVKQLGGTPVAAPKTNFQPTLDKGLETVLMTAATVENLGAAAYFGQAGRIKSKEILAAALSIHSVEARHAAALNQLVGRGFKGKGPLEGSLPDGAFAKPLDMKAVLAQAKPFIAA